MQQGQKSLQFITHPQRAGAAPYSEPATPRVQAPSRSIGPPTSAPFHCCCHRPQLPRGQPVPPPALPLKRRRRRRRRRCRCRRRPGGRRETAPCCRSPAGGVGNMHRLAGGREQRGARCKTMHSLQECNNAQPARVPRLHSSRAPDAAACCSRQLPATYVATCTVTHLRSEPVQQRLAAKDGAAGLHVLKVAVQHLCREDRGRRARGEVNAATCVCRTRPTIQATDGCSPNVAQPTCLPIQPGSAPNPPPSAGCTRRHRWAPPRCTNLPGSERCPPPLAGGAQCRPSRGWGSCDREEH